MHCYQFNWLKAYRRTMTTCQSMESMTLKVHTSPSLISFSRQNLLQPDPTWWLLCLYGRTRTCHNLVLLSEVLNIIVEASQNPITSQKAAGKGCMNSNNIDQKLITVSNHWHFVYQSGWIHAHVSFRGHVHEIKTNGTEVLIYVEISTSIY